MGRSQSLTDEQKLEIYRLNQENVSQRKIAAELGVSYDAVRWLLKNPPVGPLTSTVPARPAQHQQVVLPAPASPPPAEHESKRHGQPWRTATSDLEYDDEPRAARPVSNIPPRPGENYYSGGPFEPPPANVFELEKGIQWIQDQVSHLYKENTDVRARLFILDKMVQINQQASAILQTVYNIQLLDGFISAVTTILETFDPEVRRAIYKELEERGVAEGAIGVVFHTDQPGG